MDGEGQFVEDIMNKNVVSIDANTTIKDAAIMMNDANVGCVIVTDGTSPIGIITERDLVRRVMINDLQLDKKVTDVMSTPLIAANINTPIWDLAQKMKINSLHKIPIQDDGQLVGIVTATDIVKAHSLASKTELCKITEQILSRISKDQ